MLGDNCPNTNCKAWLSKKDITTLWEQDSAQGDQDPIALGSIHCRACGNEFEPTFRITFDAGGVAQEDKVLHLPQHRLVREVEDRYKTHGLNSFSVLVLAEQRYAVPSPASRGCGGHLLNTALSRLDLVWNMVYQYGSIKDALTAMLPHLDWSGVQPPP